MHTVQIGILSKKKAMTIHIRIHKLELFQSPNDTPSIVKTVEIIPTIVVEKIILSVDCQII